MAYDPDALDALSMEKQLTEATDAELTETIFKQNAARAALKIADIAMNGSSDSLQFRAATYICDRVLGPAKASGLKGGEAKDALEDFVRGIVSHSSN